VTIDRRKSEKKRETLSASAQEKKFAITALLKEKDPVVQHCVFGQQITGVLIAT